MSANVTGIGPYKLVNGVRRYSSSRFGPARSTTTEAHIGGVLLFRWFTRRPPGGTIKTDDHNGGVLLSSRDSGEPYARDWNYPLFAPLARDHC